MARILIGTIPVAGHVAPFLPLARRLLERGHEVAWYTGAKFQRKVERSGAGYLPFRAAMDYDDADFDASFPGRAKHRGLAQLRFDMKHVFIDGAPGQLEDLERLVVEWKPDVLVGDPGMLGSVLLRERRQVPGGVMGVLPLVPSSRDTAPFGLGLPGRADALGRVRNWLLAKLVQGVLFRDVQKHWNAMRAKLQLAPTRWWIDAAVERVDFYLQPTIPEFEYPRSDLPSCVRFIGPVPGEAPFEPEHPDFWDELDGSKPVVHVTQGTLANVEPHLIRAALDGLAEQDVLVVVATGGRDPEQMGLGVVPANARICRFLPYPTFLPKVAVMVTNGGYGGVQMALQNGIPLVVAGASEDKPEVAARVAWSGTGLNLRTATPSAAAVRDAVQRLLGEPAFRQRAKALSEAYATYDALNLAAEVVERVASQG